MKRIGVRERSVFINVPFDLEYEPLYLALIAGLIGLDLLPRCVLEVPAAGKAIRGERRWASYMRSEVPSSGIGAVQTWTTWAHCCGW